MTQSVSSTPLAADQDGGGPRITTLVVRGGWEGHDPVGCTDRVLAALGDRLDVEIADTFEAYGSVEDLLRFDLVVQCWSMGMLTAEQEAALVGAVEAGVGFAGWHGGAIGTCVANARYLRMVGGRFVWHPDGSVPYRVSVVPEAARHPVVAGIEDFDVCTEQYWVLSDAGNDVLATCTFMPEAGDPWHEPVDMPVTWTRQWGRGRVFVCTLGHAATDLAVPQTAAMVERGLLWAARRA